MPPDGSPLASLRRVLSLFRHEVRIIRTDPTPIILLALVPLVAIQLGKPLFGAFLQQHGLAGANGSEQAIPGFVILFSLYLPGYVALAFFREHAWATWDRLRVSGATTMEIVVAKLLPWVCLGLLQQVLLFSLGRAFGLPFHGSVGALVLVGVTMVVTWMALAMALTALARTTQQINAFTNMGGIVLAGLGGAVVPLAAFPGWVATIAPALPTYWAMRGFHSVLIDEASYGAVALPVVVLLLFTVALAAMAAFRFRVDVRKEIAG